MDGVMMTTETAEAPDADHAERERILCLVRQYGDARAALYHRTTARDALRSAHRDIDGSVQSALTALHHADHARLAATESALREALAARTSSADPDAVATLTREVETLRAERDEAHRERDKARREAAKQCERANVAEMGMLDVATALGLDAEASAADIVAAIEAHGEDLATAKRDLATMCAEVQSADATWRRVVEERGEALSAAARDNEDADVALAALRAEAHRLRALAAQLDAIARHAAREVPEPRTRAAMMSAATDCPACPKCGLPSVCGPRAHDLVCSACGLLWVGTPEQRAQAERADAAYEAEIAAETARIQARTERSLARQAFLDAGKPIPAWLAAMDGDEGGVPVRVYPLGGE